MSKIRQKVWLNEASDEDFFDIVRTLEKIYIKKTGNYLLQDYQANEKVRALSHNEKNNVPLKVPFSSPSDAPGSIVEEQKSATDQALDELMDIL